MKNRVYILIALIVLLSSCKNEDELSPSKAVLGVYQKVDVDFNDELSLFRTFELKAGNKVVFQGFFREKGESEKLGYQFYFEGTYTLEDDVLVMDYENTFVLSDPDITYVPKEELPQIERDFTLDERYKVSEDYQELTYICPPNAFCAPPVPFVKVPPISG